MFAYKLHPAGTDSVSAENYQSAGTQENLLNVLFFFGVVGVEKASCRQILCLTKTKHMIRKKSYFAVFGHFFGKCFKVFSQPKVSSGVSHHSTEA